MYDKICRGFHRVFNAYTRERKENWMYVPGSVRVFLSSRKLALDWENVFQIAGFIGDAQSIPERKSRLVPTETRDLVVIYSIF